MYSLLIIKCTIVILYCVKYKTKKNCIVKTVYDYETGEWNKPAAVSVRAAFPWRWHKGRAVDGSTSDRYTCGGIKPLYLPINTIPLLSSSSFREDLSHDNTIAIMVWYENRFLCDKDPSSAIRRL